MPAAGREKRSEMATGGDERIFVAGHRGMVGSAIVRALRRSEGPEPLLRDRSALNLGDQSAVEHFFKAEKPTLVFLAAARVGGIQANSSYPAEFFYENLILAANVIHAAWRHGTRRLVFLGSTCIYPRLAPQPIPEDALLTSPLESTNEAYAIAKIAGLKMCAYYRQQYGVCFHSAMPTNLYGPGDNYHPEHSHVLPALIRRIHEAKESCSPEVVIWGTGTPRREFLHVDDVAEGILHLAGLENPPDWVNLGTGEDITIRELAEKIASVVGYTGEIRCDPARPDGTPRKQTDMRLLHSTGWRHRIALEEGLKDAYADFLEQRRSGRLREA